MNLASRNYQEKRSFIRMKVETPISVQTVEGVTLSGTCHNISGGGMLISVSEALPLGTELEVAVTAHSGFAPMLIARTSVSRVMSQPNAQEQPCYAGLEILEILE